MIWIVFVLGCASCVALIVGAELYSAQHLDWWQCPECDMWWSNAHDTRIDPPKRGHISFVIKSCHECSKLSHAAETGAAEPRVDR